jgi:hypothetical protein
MARLLVLPCKIYYNIIKVAVIGVVINREVVVIGEVTSREEEEVVVTGTSNNNMGVEETQ